MIVIAERVVLVASLICFLLAFLGVGSKYNLVALGLALFILTLIF